MPAIAAQVCNPSYLRGQDGRTGMSRPTLPEHLNKTLSQNKRKNTKWLGVRNQVEYLPGVWVTLSLITSAKTRQARTMETVG